MKESMKGLGENSKSIFLMYRKLYSPSYLLHQTDDVVRIDHDMTVSPPHHKA